ncbi:hypothetical protein BRAS3843_770024 [Bradyrhizobium sp. STM 3843]|uniref:hypothetical protein n=1 Tax=Bradyrhizobium sp. STM 3843 TaxID=551947 RepID=UPI0002404A23|nr:hypothetical protein [Bradyrhizobium sp. STM 3843]CCE11726.1 hypothetical protein BRAS3843_770024 [Bradyrhizobium sp. STM 3843]
MVTRRKPRKYRDGGAVLADAPPIAETVSPATADGPAQEIPPASPDTSEAVFRALEATRNAERLAALHQQAPRQVVQQPTMSERRRAFIAEHPELADPVNAEAVNGYWRQALRMGMAEDSHDLDSFVQRALAFELGSRVHQAEAEAVAKAALPATPAPAAPRPELPPSMAEPRRNMPLTAPVERAVPSYGGKRTSGMMHLTEEERRIARNSFVDRPDLPKMTDAQKEYLYAQSKAKYEAMKASGEYDTTQGRQR